MDNDHGITGELREWWVRKFPIMDKELHKDFTAIANRIDAEHQKAIRELNNLADASVLLPVDADGEVIHIGDVVTVELLFGGRSKPLVVDRMELSHGKGGELWCIALDTDKECWNLPSLMHHHKPPTVEDVLHELVDEWVMADSTDDEEAAIAECAKKLQLRGDEQ